MHREVSQAAWTAACEVTSSLIEAKGNIAPHEVSEQFWLAALDIGAHWARVRGVSESDSMDVALDAYVALLEKPYCFGCVEQLVACYKLAVLTKAKKWRLRHRESMSGEVSQVYEPSVQREDDLEKVLALLAGLPAEDATLVWQYVVEGKTYAEIAAMEEVSIATIWRRVRDIFGYLRGLLVQ